MTSTTPARLSEEELAEREDYARNSGVVPAFFFLEALAELRSSRMSGTRVKALEWRDQRGHSFPDMWDARSQCGVYQIEERSASDQPAYVVTGPFYAFIADVDSLEEAKAAAQADYEARILSALAPRAEPEPVQAPRIKFDVAKYVESYEFRGDGWDHTPTEDEAALLVDALEGALYEIEASLSPTHPASKAGEPTEGQRSWRCFHCDETFTNEHDARLHFGDDESRTPACLLKGAEGSLLEALRRAERDASEAWHAVHSETIDAVKAYHAQLARHQEQLRSVEVLGYERGLADAKAHPETLGLTALAPTEENGRG